jgi:predicted transcriptional regulator
MPGQSRRAPGELEAEVLGALWRADSPLSPGQVRDELGADLAYTTVMTILSRLHDKGSVTRSRVGRAFVYTPAFEQAELAASQMRSLLEAGHDREAVLARFVGSLSADD